MIRLKKIIHKNSVFLEVDANNPRFMIYKYLTSISSNQI